MCVGEGLPWLAETKTSPASERPGPQLRRDVMGQRWGKGERERARAFRQSRGARERGKGEGETSPASHLRSSSSSAMPMLLALSSSSSRTSPRPIDAMCASVSFFTLDMAAPRSK